MKIGCCLPGAPFVLPNGTRTPDNPASVLEAGYYIARDAGYDYAECGAGTLLKLTEEELDCLQELQEHGEFHIECCNVFIPGSIPLVGPGRVDAGQHVREVCRLMQKAGARIIVFGSGGARRIPEGVDAATAQRHIEEFLVQGAEIAAEYGVTIAIEPLNRKECNILTSLEEAAGYVRRLNLPNVRLLADAYHMAAEGELPEAVEAYAEILAHVHVAEPETRTYPGSGEGTYLRRLGEALRRIGYTGRVSIECSFDSFSAQCPLAVPFMRGAY